MKNNLFLRNEGIAYRILIYLYEHQLISEKLIKMAKEINCAYTSFSKLSKQMEKQGYIKYIPGTNKRSKNIKLSKKGEIIAKELIRIKSIIEEKS